MSLTSSSYKRVLEMLIAGLLLVYPIALLHMKGGMNITFLFTLLFALVLSAVRPRDMPAIVWQREWTSYTLAMLGMTVAIFISQSWFQNYDGHPFDAASRYWLAIPVFLVLYRLRLNVFRTLDYAFPLAAISGLLMAHEVGIRAGIDTLDLIHFGNFELALGFLSVLSLDLLGKDKLPLRLLKIIGLVAGVLASIGSGSRGGWLAIPVFIVLIAYFKMGKISPKKIIGGLIAGLLSAVLLYASNDTVHQRVVETHQDVSKFNAGNRDTSIGVRIQLYLAAVDVFARHPLFGVGPEGFATEMKPMAEAGKLTKEAAHLGEGEVHNDILSKAAGMGIWGLLAILAVYFFPLKLFWRAAHSANDSIKRGGLMGVTFVSGFVVYGFTVEFLNLTLATAFYSFTVAVLLAFCYNIHHPPENAVPQSK